MKFHAEHLDHLTREDLRVLAIIELGSRNHEIVPMSFIQSASGIAGDVGRIGRGLCGINLISHSPMYNGYKLGYGGYDYLALHALVSRSQITKIGGQVGTGKESDIFLVLDGGNQERILKIHRLGRTCFRTVRTNRDYLGKRKHASWIYLSRVAASREYAFMRALHAKGFPVPIPIDHNRHCVLMSRIDGCSLHQVDTLADPKALYDKLMNLIVRLAEHGLVHGDFNEFNLMIDTQESPIVMDFPQMVSIKNPRAKEYFVRDTNCIKTWFERRFKYNGLECPKFDDMVVETDLGSEILTRDYSENAPTRV